ncbi:MAG: histidine kinase [Eubacterium sp.]|nr:histidine kinase [Eubacterium sp.]
MGTNKINKRTPLQKQIAFSYLKVLFVSLVTAVVTIIVFYFIYYRVTGFDSSKTEGMEKIYQYIYENGSVLLKKDHLDKLDMLVKEKHLAYLIKDSDNNILYSSGASSKQNISSFGKHLSEMKDNFIHKSTIDIPVYDGATGKVKNILIMTYEDNLALIDFVIPLTCLVVFLIVFSKEFSQRISKPLKELINSVDKIKQRDLDFVINDTLEDEIGDLARAFEEMRKSLQNSLMREWQLEQERRDMVAAITHDLRTPLAIIQGHAEGLQDGLKYNNDKLDSYLTIIEQNSLRAKKLIEEMNMLVEIDGAGFELNQSLTDINEYLKDKASEAAYLAEKEMISLETEISDLRAESELVYLDTDRLSQIIDNILNNAIRYTPKGGSISFCTSIKNDRADFKIYDTGKGFLEKDLPNLFKKFYKGDASRSMNKGHSGLGLYIAHSIVKKYGGEIKGYNLNNGGACIEFSIYY